MTLTVHLLRIREPEDAREDDEDLAQRHGRDREVAGAESPSGQEPQSLSENALSTNRTARPTTRQQQDPQRRSTVAPSSWPPRCGERATRTTPVRQLQRPSLMTPISREALDSSMSCDEMNDTVHGCSPPAVSRMPCVTPRARARRARRRLVQDEQFRAIRQRGHQRGLHPRPAREGLQRLVHRQRELSCE